MFVLFCASIVRRIGPKKFFCALTVGTAVGVLLLMLTGHSKRMMRGSGNVDGMVFNLQHYPYVSIKNYTPHDTASYNLPVTAYNFHGGGYQYTYVFHRSGCNPND